jgi:hypothetical protein
MRPLRLLTIGLPWGLAGGPGCAIPGDMLVSKLMLVR